MKIKQLIIFFILILITSNLYCQTDTVSKIKNPEYFYRQKINVDTVFSRDTIKLFLDDTSYYNMERDLLYEFNNKIGYLKYFNSSIGLNFVLKDSLQDGFYCLYNLTKKQAKKMKTKDKNIVVSGEFKNKMKQGAFCFYFIQETSKCIKANKVIYFKDDIVHGAVIERENDKIMFLGEYQMGVKHGFFYYYNGGAPAIVLYENGKQVKYSNFW